MDIEEVRNKTYKKWFSPKGPKPTSKLEKTKSKYQKKSTPTRTQRVLPP